MLGCVAAPGANGGSPRLTASVAERRGQKNHSRGTLGRRAAAASSSCQQLPNNRRFGVAGRARQQIYRPEIERALRIEVPSLSCTQPRHAPEQGRGRRTPRAVLVSAGCRVCAAGSCASKLLPWKYLLCPSVHTSQSPPRASTAAAATPRTSRAAEPQTCQQKFARLGVRHTTRHVQVGLCCGPSGCPAHRRRPHATTHTPHHTDAGRCSEQARMRQRPRAAQVHPPHTPTVLQLQLSCAACF